MESQRVRHNWVTFISLHFIYCNGLSLTSVPVTPSSLPLGIEWVGVLLGGQHFAFVPENLVWMTEGSLTGLKMMQKFWWLRVILWQNFSAGSAQRQRVMDSLLNKIQFLDIHYLTPYSHFFFEFLYEITTIGSSLVLACMDSFYVCTGVSFIMSFSGGTSGKEPSCQCKLDETRAGSIPGWGRRPGGGHGNPLQYSCLENPMDRGAWLVTIHRIAKVRHDWNDLARRHTLVYYIRVWCFSE